MSEARARARAPAAKESLLRFVASVYRRKQKKDVLVVVGASNVRPSALRIPF